MTNKRTGIIDSPLHSGKSPWWLQKRMEKLSREITKLIVYEYGSEYYLNKISDPVWFQAFGCALGFDWHSSGLTTTVTGALKAGLKDVSKELGVCVCGGKGKTSRKTPDEINFYGEEGVVNEDMVKDLTYASRMAAKVDSALVQDGYDLYHHSFIFNEEGKWVVIQQGMSTQNKMARRYHWISEHVEDFVVEPELAICSDNKTSTLNLVSKESRGVQDFSVDLVSSNLNSVFKDLKRISYAKLPNKFSSKENYNTKYMQKIIQKLNENKPKKYEGLVSTQGFGPKTVRALSLIGELVYGEKPSYNDPAKYSFAHGGKDGVPCSVNRHLYDETIDTLQSVVAKVKVEKSEKNNAHSRLKNLHKRIV